MRAIRLSDEFLGKVDGWAAKQEDKPSRSEAIRRLVEIGLKKGSNPKESLMDQSEFEAQLKADGYQEIELQELAPRPGKGRHRHLFAVRGLVLSGTFSVTQTGDPVAYGPGQIFAVAHGELHDESVGSNGARVLVGRKFSGEKTSAASSRSS